MIECEIEGLSLKETSYRSDASETACFNFRQRLYEMASKQMEYVQLVGQTEVDSTYAKINLSGTKPADMPRLSKKRGKQIFIGYYLAEAAALLAEKHGCDNKCYIDDSNGNPHVETEGGKYVAMEQSMQGTLGAAARAFPSRKNIEATLGESHLGVGVEHEIDGSECKKHRCRQYNLMFPMQTHQNPIDTGLRMRQDHPGIRYRG